MIFSKEIAIAVVLIMISITGIIKCTNFVVRGMFIALCIYAGNLISRRYLGFDLFAYLRALLTLQTG